MKGKRHFEFVAFWGDVAWVAGTTTYNAVAQGQTLARAVENLKYSLQVDAQWALNEGKQPFIIDYDGKRPLDSFANPGNASPMPRGREEPKKGTRYRGTLDVYWGNVEVRQLREQAEGRRRSGRNR